MTELHFGVPGSQLPTRDPGRGPIRAEGAGFDSMWWADRLMGWMPDGPHALLDPVPLIATAATATTDLRLGTAVIDPLRRHPAQAAQSALSLQQLSGGRLILGLGCGEAAGTRPYGIDFDRPVSRFEEALEMLSLLWQDGEPVDFSGDFFELDGAICGLAATVDTPPVWIASHGPRMLGITGTRADGWLPTGYGPEQYRQGLATIRDAAREAERDPGSVEPGLFIWLVAAGSREEARELMRDTPLRALGLLLPAGALSGSPLPEGPWEHVVPTQQDLLGIAQQVDPDELAEVVPHGTPDDIADDLTGYVEAGATHIVLCDMSALGGRRTSLGMSPTDVHAAVRDALLGRLG